MKEQLETNREIGRARELIRIRAYRGLNSRGTRRLAEGDLNDRGGPPFTTPFRFSLFRFKFYPPASEYEAGLQSNLNHTTLSPTPTVELSIFRHVSQKRHCVAPDKASQVRPTNPATLGIHQQNRTLVPEGTRWYAEVRDGTRSLNAILGTFTQNSKPPWYAMVRDGTREFWQGV